MKKKKISHWGKKICCSMGQNILFHIKILSVKFRRNQSIFRCRVTWRRSVLLVENNSPFINETTLRNKNGAKVYFGGWGFFDKYINIMKLSSFIFIRD